MKLNKTTKGASSPVSHTGLAVPAGRCVAALRPLIDQGLYFVINAPRQSGKTTSIRTLATALTREGTYAS